ncbi:hypothetical protein [Sulfurimonas sp. NW9]
MKKALFLDRDGVVNVEKSISIREKILNLLMVYLICVNIIRI